ncbi:MAG: LacI family transcriptional regulator [Pseudarthrobacter sp.]|nr:LacI family transcriptional regulator [Pseudarthrobacter sp.]
MSSEVSPTPPRNPRMIDVARLAGVSQQTVSRLVNGDTNMRPEIRERVEDAIRQLQYRRNTAARALATNRTMDLGVISFGLAQYGPSVALFGIADEARKAGYATSLVTLEDVGVENIRRGLDHLVADSVDGIIVLAPVQTAMTALSALPTAVPLVVFAPGADEGIANVAVDEVLGARLATRHLLELGHETVWHVSGPQGWLGAEARIRGWRAELASAGRVANIDFEGDWSAESGYLAGRKIAANPDITAVFVANDQMALGLLSALAEAGRSVPEEVSVVGFDDVPESRFYAPGLTTVRLDFSEVGRLCVERILDLMKGAALDPVPRLQPALIHRSSTAPPHIGDAASAALQMPTTTIM